MPSVANGARRHAWNASSCTPPSGMGFSCKIADLRHEIGGNVNAVALRLLPVAQPSLAGQAHLGLLRHRGDERLDALEIHLVSGERRGIDRDEGLADSRGPAFLGEETVGLEAERRSRQRADEEL